jgi:hypothetical protein
MVRERVAEERQSMQLISEGRQEVEQKEERGNGLVKERGGRVDGRRFRDLLTEQSDQGRKRGTSTSF